MGDDQEPSTRITLSQVYSLLLETKDAVTSLGNANLPIRVARLERLGWLAVGGISVIGFALGAATHPTFKF